MSYRALFDAVEPTFTRTVPAIVSTSSPPRPHLDPRDVASVSRALRIGTPGSGLHPIGMRQIEIGPRALDTLPEIVAGIRRPGAIAMLVDATPMTWRGSDLKAHVQVLMRYWRRRRR